MKVGRLLPIDPDYAPFGWRWLRGMNALPLAIFVPIAVSRSLSDIKTKLAFRGETSLHDMFVASVAVVPAQTFLRFTFVTMMMVICIAVLNLTEGRSNRWRIACFEAALLVGAILVQLLAVQLAYGLGLRPMSFQGWTAFNSSVCLEYLLFGNLAAAPLYLRRRRQAAVGTLRQAKLRRVDAQRQATEARLQSLQAQIEPHFLFNTLAHILRLLQIDPQRGRAMLRSLADYMRSALPQLRAKDFTLGHELALTRAYANVQQIRMGDRLQVEIDVPPALMAARVPAMTVLTLAENAVKHGIGPKREGGTLRIEASLQGEMLEVAVCDDGVGLQIGAGSGHGLANTRSRLTTAYGPRAALEIGNRPAGGVRAALVLPFAAVAAPGQTP